MVPAVEPEHQQGMRYLDSGYRDPKQTLAAWFADISNDDVVRLRLQTGFYSLDGLAPLLDVFQRFKDADFPIAAVIGSNGGGTLRADVSELAFRIGVPRPLARLAVVSFGGSAFFHPKVYHVERRDGTAAAYVGSANLTANGTSLHVEAGVALDSREDGLPELTKIAAAIDRWFDEVPPGTNLVTDDRDLERLESTGVLARFPLPRPSGGTGGASGAGASRPSLGRLAEVKPVPRLVSVPPAPQASTDQNQSGVSAAAPTGDAAQEQHAPPAQPPTTAANSAPGTPAAGGQAKPVAAAPSVGTNGRPSAPRAGFPTYLMFEPAATASTSGVNALTGAALPNNAAGLIVRLNRDSARHFEGRNGTSNISVPVASVHTIRFGIAGLHHRPSAEFMLRMRYVGDAYSREAAITTTSVSGYGFTAGESGHGDVRLVVTAEARRLKARIESDGFRAPEVDHYALLEWPTAGNPIFKLTFLDPQSNLFQLAAKQYAAASSSNALVGQGACWLPPGLAPNW
jgi:hypothetical protein